LYTLKTKIDTGSEEFKNNKKEFEKLLKEYRERMQMITRGGSKRAVDLHKKRGKKY
jgi:acetyl-CoA carboxylase carboxyltransferase component